MEKDGLPQIVTALAFKRYLPLGSHGLGFRVWGWGLRVLVRGFPSSPSPKVLPKFRTLFGVLKPHIFLRSSLNLKPWAVYFGGGTIVTPYPLFRVWGLGFPSKLYPPFRRS